jgi:hypothetical protein
MAQDVRRIVLIAITLGTVAAIAILLTPKARVNSAAATTRPRRQTIAGAFHVHTNRSPDSSGTIEEAVAAAGRAGLQFVVATEHGDGTRAPLPPAYRSGILWIDGVEISTGDGHYATFGMRQSPFPLAGDARDVAEDVARLGGTGVAAHGDSLKSEAQWKDWTAPIDGLEWLNLDSVWREAGPLRLARAAFTYWVRPSAALASMASRPVASLAHLDTIAADRRIITLAATDAHGRVVPSYDACFGAFSTRVELDRPFTGDALADARALVDALRAGHHYTSIDALARPALFEFSARSGGVDATEGDRLAAGQSVAFDIRVEGAPDAHAVLLRNGVALQESRASTWRHETDGRRAEYRVEVTLPGSPGQHPLPWLLSNPIFVGIPDTHERSVQTPEGTALPGARFDWRTEKDQTSRASLAATASGLDVRYTLGGGSPANQFVAAAAPLPPILPQADAIAFTARADRPMRFSVEIRAMGDRRWQRSVYADQTPRRVTVAFNDMRPVQPDAAAHPPLSTADALLVLVGVSHTSPGAQGELSLTDIGLLKF